MDRSNVISRGGGGVAPEGQAMPAALEMSLRHGHHQLQQPRQLPTPPSAAASPWQRMKWTDSMVRLLIMIVYCVGDDAAAAASEGDQSAGVGKGNKAAATATSAAAGLMLQKKGKWKSVSRAMMEKGYNVSPQQCEDKFNDLNKRYKRVNELLGRGTACRVVENQALLDTLPHLSAKARDEARKLLNSKHLFFREMCAYHHTCGAGGAVVGGATGAAASSSAALMHQPQPPPGSQNQPQCFFHQSDSATSTPQAMFMPAVNLEDNADIHDDDDESGDHDDDDDDSGDEDEGDDEEREPMDLRAATRTSLSASPPLSLSLSSSPPQMSTEQDLRRALACMEGEQQQRQWLKRKAAELEEQRVAYQCRALELERQRFKWLRFSSNKEREMEKMKLRNERLGLKNRRMLLLLQQKEQELAGNAHTTAATSSTLQFAS